MWIDIFQVDAFSREVFGGNPAGVVPNSKGLSEKDMQLIAREMNVSETAFVEEIEEDYYNVRFFTPREEVDLCGHATIGTFFIFADREYIKPIENGVKKIFQNTGAGKLPVYISYKDGKVEKVSMEQASPKKFGGVTSLDNLAEALGLKPDEIGMEDSDLEAEIVSTGLKDILLPVKSKRILDKIQVDNPYLSKISLENDVVGVHAYYMPDIDGDQVYTRNFAPRVGIDEESATGTSNGALIYLLKEKGILKGNSLTVYQGESMERPSQIECEITDDSVVMVGGQARIVVEGKLTLGR